MKRILVSFGVVALIACIGNVAWRLLGPVRLRGKYAPHEVTWRHRTIRVPYDFAVSVRNGRLGITRVDMTQPDTLPGIGLTTLIWSGDRTPARDSSFEVWQGLCARNPSRCIASVARDHRDGLICAAQKGPVHVGARCRRSDKDLEMEYVGDSDGVETFRTLAARIFALP